MTEKAKILGNQLVNHFYVKNNHIYMKDDDTGEINIAHGMNKREYFAAMAMLGFISRNNREINSEAVSEKAIEYADALLEELSKTE